MYDIIYSAYFLIVEYKRKGIENVKVVYYDLVSRNFWFSNTCVDYPFYTTRLG